MTWLQLHSSLLAIQRDSKGEAQQGSQQAMSLQDVVEHTCFIPALQTARATARCASGCLVCRARGHGSRIELPVVQPSSHKTLMPFPRLPTAPSLPAPQVRHWPQHKRECAALQGDDGARVRLPWTVAVLPTLQLAQWASRLYPAKASICNTTLAVGTLLWSHAQHLLK